MNNSLTESYERFVTLFNEENYSRDNNKELLQLKRDMISGFQADEKALQKQSCIAPLIDIRIRMNHFFFASNEERSEVDGLLSKAFRNNASMVTNKAVTARLEKVYGENDPDWGGHLAVAAAMITAKPDALEERAWNNLVDWSKRDGEREKSDRRRAFVSLFAKRCGKDWSF
ncbi:MAG TPA: hypothetical protein DCY07_02445 [Rhodospirillaceae bacterium]|nr:hypothetical protein [Rhodospirillaceae bacterium]